VTHMDRLNFTFVFLDKRFLSLSTASVFEGATLGEPRQKCFVLICVDQNPYLARMVLASRHWRTTHTTYPNPGQPALPGEQLIPTPDIEMLNRSRTSFPHPVSRIVHRSSSRRDKRVLYGTGRELAVAVTRRRTDGHCMSS
jgi:hypothetical protein